MVAFYLQNTKKMVSIFFLIVILISSNCKTTLMESSNCEEIKDYLEMELSFSAYTVKHGESLYVNVLYRNKTDSLLLFYPKAVIRLTRSFVGFVNFVDLEYESYWVHDLLDATFCVEIEAKSTYLQTFEISINSPFFIEGDNRLTLAYVCKEMKGESKIYNKLCGFLESQEVNLFVVPP